MRLFVRAAFVAASIALPFRVPAAAACSVCQAGDPLYSAGGASAQEAGSYSAYLELQGWRKTSGLLPEEEGAASEPGREVNEGQQITTYLSASPIDRLTLTLAAPYRFNAIVEEPAEADRSRSTLSGVGDLSLTAGWVLWRDRDVLPSTWVEGRVFGKAPTGQRSQAVDGKTDPHLQLGTGSWDFGFGVAWGHREEWGSIYSSFLYRINEPGALDYQYGDVFLANLALEAPLGHLAGMPALDAITPGFELNYRWAAYDESHGQRYRDSGGDIVYATPTLRLRLPWLEGRRAPSLRFSAQLPLMQSGLHHQQHEGVVWSTGLMVPF